MRLIDADRFMKYLNDEWMRTAPNDTDGWKTKNERCAMCRGLDRAMKMLKEFPNAAPEKPKRLAFNEVFHNNRDPLYIVTKDAKVDCWTFYAGYLDVKGLYLCRDQDGRLHDFWRDDYGKTWLCFTGRVTDKMWKELEWDAAD